MTETGVVSVFISSNVSSFTSQKRFPLTTTILELKGKLELVTGADAKTMSLQLFDFDQKFICSLDNDMATLQSYHVGADYRIHAFDATKTKGQFEDVSSVQRYEMSDDDYAKRGESLRAFKEKMKLGQFANKEDSQPIQKKDEQEIAQKIPLHSRCEVNLPGVPPKRGEVMFVGETHFKAGYWIGVKYDEPLGKNNGSVGGEKYFECPMKYGAFVKPSSVSVGDYPEITYSDDEM